MYRNRLMKKAKKLFAIMIMLLLCTGMLSSLSACGKRNVAEEDLYMIYYCNQDADDLIYQETEIKDSASKEQVDLAQQLLDTMFTYDPENTTYYSVKPRDVHLNGMIIKDGVITLDFDSNYLKMSNVREILMRASVVLTLIQINGIDGVAFTVEGEPVTDGKGNAIGTMTREHFVNVLLNEEGMLKQETDLRLYFCNEANTQLVPITYRFTIDNSNSSLEEYIVAKLIEGPEKGVANPTLGKNIKVISVVTTDYICYVNFDPSFLEQNQVVSDELMIYSIVNSLCELPYVNGVQILVDGESEIMLHKTFSLAQVLRRNTDLIEK